LLIVSFSIYIAHVPVFAMPKHMACASIRVHTSWITKSTYIAGILFKTKRTLKKLPHCNHNLQINSIAEKTA
jgi:hypothetical protein